MIDWAGPVGRVVSWTAEERDVDELCLYFCGADEMAGARGDASDDM